MAPSIKDMAEALSANHWKTLNDFHKNTVSRVLGKIRTEQEVKEYDKVVIINLFLEYEVYEKCND